jgi:plastocyanin
LWLAAALVALSVWPGVAFAASSVTGTVTFEGKAPALKPLTMDADPACAKKHTGPVPSEMLVLGSGNTMGNIMVWVSKGLPAGKTWPAPKTPVTLDQKGCQYLPHVQGIMVGQTYRILNSDGILHNVHALPKINKQFNRAMPATLKEATATFEKEEAVFQILYDSLVFAELRQSNAENFPGNRSRLGETWTNSRRAGCIAWQQLDATASREGE